ncbi:hypothetical protein ERJ75_001330100 [Trypanosoma vivax]|uniref:Proteasome assembly chaperone 3 n=1 Tax=Trypanosoma vivax (strain Y486) TaxID=1055687 RepID=G0TRN8_TRYVY|nr:hypothetical protein TRVL_02418 [Trypanosoma vivax]KAH8608243.1 hypothetical protein ERJ75_001330100 [Trypanosoma vivax]CCC46609.1 conserved hypothetical protein [Trypanosoma vivax Y486]
MPAPRLYVRQFTFTHEVALGDCDVMESPACGTEHSVPVVSVTLQVLAFGQRCFWVHVSEKREGPNTPPPAFGSCAVALCGVGRDGSSATLIDDATPLSQEQSAGCAPNPQVLFANSLAQRLARRLERTCKSGVAVYVACGITSDKRVDLLGTPAGYGSSVTMRFGSEVFKNIMELMHEEVLKEETTTEGDVTL